MTANQPFPEWNVKNVLPISSSSSKTDEYYRWDHPGLGYNMVVPTTTASIRCPSFVAVLQESWEKRHPMLSAYSPSSLSSSSIQQTPASVWQKCLCRGCDQRMDPVAQGSCLHATTQSLSFALQENKVWALSTTMNFFVAIKQLLT